MKRELETTSQAWEAEATVIREPHPASLSGGEGDDRNWKLPRSLQEIADVGLSTRRVFKLIALFVIIVAVEAVLLAHVPDSSTLRVYQAPEQRILVKP